MSGDIFGPHFVGVDLDNLAVHWSGLLKNRVTHFHKLSECSVAFSKFCVKLTHKN